MKLLALSLLLFLNLSADMQLAPDGTPQLAPDGTFVGSGEIQITPEGQYMAVTPAESNDNHNPYNGYYNQQHKENPCHSKH